MMDEYRKRYDTFYAFVSTCCEVTKDKTEFIKKADFENEYEEYCIANELTAISKRNIKDRAASQGIVLKWLHGAQVYRGIRFKSVAQEELKGTGFAPVQEAIPF